MNTRFSGNLSIVPHETDPVYFGDGSLMVDEEILCDTFSAATPNANVHFKDATVHSHLHQTPEPPSTGQTQLYASANHDGRLIMVKPDGSTIDLNPLQARGDTMVYDGLMQTAIRLPLGLPGQLFTVDPLNSMGPALGWRSLTVPAHRIANTSQVVKYVALSAPQTVSYSGTASPLLFDTVDRADTGTTGTTLHTGIYDVRFQIQFQASAAPRTLQVRLGTREILVATVPASETTFSGICFLAVPNNTSSQKLMLTLNGDSDIRAGSTILVTKLRTETRYLTARITASVPVTLPTNVPWNLIDFQNSLPTTLDGGAFIVSTAGTYHIFGLVTVSYEGNQVRPTQVSVTKNGQVIATSTGLNSVSLDALTTLTAGDSVAAYCSSNGRATFGGIWGMNLIEADEVAHSVTGSTDLTANEFRNIAEYFVKDGGTYLISSLAHLQNTDATDGQYVFRFTVDGRQVINSDFTENLAASQSISASGSAMMLLAPNSTLILQGVSVTGTAATCAGQMIVKKYETLIAPIPGYPDFGRFYKTATRSTALATTSGTLREYLRLDTGDVPHGEYHIKAVVDWTMTSPGAAMEIALVLHDANMTVLDAYAPTCTVRDQVDRSVLTQVVTLTEGRYILSVRVRSLQPDSAAAKLVKGTIDSYLTKRI